MVMTGRKRTDRFRHVARNSRPSAVGRAVAATGWLADISARQRGPYHSLESASQTRP